VRGTTTERVKVASRIEGKTTEWTIMLLNGDDVARCVASFRESKWLVGMNYIVIY
jgi:hypothetical protein